jgi:hypothetical protein
VVGGQLAPPIPDQQLPHGLIQHEARPTLLGRVQLQRAATRRSTAKLASVVGTTPVPSAPTSSPYTQPSPRVHIARSARDQPIAQGGEVLLTRDLKTRHHARC